MPCRTPVPTYEEHPRHCRGYAVSPVAPPCRWLLTLLAGCLVLAGAQSVSAADVWDAQQLAGLPLSLKGVTAIAAGQSYAVVRKADGTVVVWGNAAPDTPSDLRTATAVAAGALHILALRTDGTVLAWGDNGRNQTTVPTGLVGVTAVAAGLRHSVALQSNG